MNKTQDRKTMLFAAGGLTGLIGVTVLVLGLGVQDLAFAASAAQPSVSVEETPVVSMSAPLLEVVVAPTTAPVAATPAVTTDATGGLQQQVLDQNAQLRQALQLMQQREEVYRQQLEEASQTILSMAAQPATGAVASQEAGSMPARSGEGAVEAWDEFTDKHEGDHEESEHEDTEHEHDAGEHDDD